MDGTSIERLEQLLAERAWLVRVARGLVRDESAAEDLAQEAWLAAWQKGPREARSWRAWLAETARRLAVRSRRSSERRERRERAVASAESLPSSDELVAKSELLELVAREVLALDEPLRATLLLRFQEGLEPRAIAARQGVPEDSVRWRLRRGLALLRERLERRLGGEWRARLVFALPSSSVPLRAPQRPGPAAASGVSVATAIGSILMMKAVIATAVAVLLLVAYVGWRAPRERSATARSAQPAGVELARSSGGSASSTGVLAANPPSERSAVLADRAPQSASASASCVLTGRVIGEATEPLAGVSVQHIVEGKWQPGVKSDENGRFRLELEHPELVSALQLVPDSYHEARLLRVAGVDDELPALVPGEHDLGTFILGAAGAVAGRVVDAGGAPIERAWLLLAPSDQLGDPGWGGWAWSDASGGFLVGHARAGSWQLAAQHLGFRIPKAQVEVAAGVTAHQDFVLVAGPTVSGRVVDEQGRGVAGVELQPCGYYYDWGLASEDDGSFVLPLANDEPCGLSVSIEGYDVVAGLGFAYAPGTSGIEIVLRPSARTLFRVVDFASGEPIELFGLAVEHEREAFTGPPAQARHAGGELRVDAREGERVSVAASGYLEDQERVRFDAPGTAVQTLRMERGAVLTGRVLRDGLPESGASVRVARRLAPGALQTRERPRNLLAERASKGDRGDIVALDPDPPAHLGRVYEALSGRTDDQGRFRIEGLQGTSYSLEVASADGAGASVDVLELRGASTDVGALALEKPVRLSGRVEFALGGTLENQTVTLEGPSERSATTDSDGRFAFERVAPGDRWLRVEPSAARIAGATAFFLRLTRGADRDVLLHLDDRPASTLRLVLTQNGAPMRVVERISFVFDDGSGDRVEVLNRQPDDGGRLTVVLPAGGAAWLDVGLGCSVLRHPCLVLLRDGESEVHADFVTGAVELELPPSLGVAEGGELALRVRASSLPGWEGTLSGRVMEGRLIDGAHRPMGTLASGRVCFEPVPAGDLVLELVADGVVLGRTAIPVPPGGRVTAQVR